MNKCTFNYNYCDFNYCNIKHSINNKTNNTKTDNLTTDKSTTDNSNTYIMTTNNTLIDKKINMFINPFANEIIYENVEPVEPVEPIENTVEFENTNTNTNINTTNTDNYIIYKQITNKNFTDYLIYNFKELGIYKIINDKIIFKFKKIGNCKKLFDKIHSKKKQFINNLQYHIHIIKIIKILDKILLLMAPKGFYFDFNEYNYQLYEYTISNNSLINNSNNDLINIIYFIKIKKNIMMLHSYSTIWLFHNDYMFEYI